MDKYDEAIRKGKQAELLLQNELFNEMLARLEAEAIEAIKTCEASDALEYKCHLMAVDRFKRIARAYLDNALIASKTVET